MDKMLNSKKEKDFIYEIYRACRLCGGGAGYKMPIIQNIIDFEEADVDLKQKIRECVQIEVHQDDKMPPLICELCVDKINDFYEFLDMCRQTNKRTRLRLGLPLQSLSKGASDAGDCILGLTEPVFVSKNSEAESVTKQKKTLKVKVKKEPVVRLKIENIEEERASRQRKREPTPQRVTRNRRSKEDDLPLTNLQDNKDHKSKTIKTETILKSALKKEPNFKKDDKPSQENQRLKRSLDRIPSKSEAPAKKVKIIIKPLPTPTPKLSSKTSSRTPLKTSPRLMPKPRLTRSHASPTAKSPSPPRPSSPPKTVYDCDICGQSYKTIQARSNHLKIHTVGFTSPSLACNPCGLWFSTAEDVAAHHRQHKNRSKPYSCRRCYTDFKQLDAYEEHLENDTCISYNEVPDKKCKRCWHTFPTANLLHSHKCLGEDNRPGGKCIKCKKNYVLLKNLKIHEKTCKAKKKGEWKISKKLLDQLKPIQIRVARCDALLENKTDNHYDVSQVPYDYGLDLNCFYPYISRLSIKSIFSGMVDIDDDIKKVFCSEDYVHWDSSDDSDSDDDISTLGSRKKRVESLTALSLKTIFSHRLIGKVPRKKRKVKIDKMFDSLLADEDDVRIDIGNIIDNLRDDDEQNIKGDDRLSTDDSAQGDSGKVNNESNNIKKMYSVESTDASIKHTNDLLLDRTNDINKQQTMNVKKNKENDDKSDTEFSLHNDIQSDLHNNVIEIKSNDSTANGNVKSIDSNNDTQDSLVENDLSSITDGKSETNDVDLGINASISDKNNQLLSINRGGELDSNKSSFISNFNMNSILSNNDTNDSNDIKDMEDVLNDTVKSKISLGLNDFSFDFK